MMTTTVLENVITNEEKAQLRTPCQVFTRVMGYLRPVSQYNIWKKSEFYSRKYFSEAKSMATIDAMIANNRKFVADFSS